MPTRTLTIGKIRGLRQITTPEGAFIILALDHRGSLGKMLGVRETDADFYGRVRDFKLRIVRHLSLHASAVLLDPQYSAAEAVASGALPGDRGLIVAIEKSGYTGTPGARVTELVPGWAAGTIKRMGASAVKLLIDYNPDAPDLAERQERLVSQLVEEARAADIALLVEPVTYSLDPDLPKGSAAFAVQKPRLVCETARRIGALGPDVLKLEFPHDAAHVTDEAAWAEACRDVDAASPVPWAVLSAGMDFETFKRQVRVACSAGASGYVAGRSFWQETARMDEASAAAFLDGEASRRMAEAAAVASRYAHPWTERYPDLDRAVAAGWHEGYVRQSAGA